MKDNYETATPPEKLAESRSERERLLQKWGFEPLSLMWITKIHDKNLDVIVEDTLAQGSYEKSNYNVRDGALPQSSPIVAERLIKFYTEPGDTVLNPMCERLPHLLIAHYLHRNVIGQDICKEFYLHDVEKVKKRIKNAQFMDSENNKITFEDDNHFFSIYNGLRFDLTCGDSRHLDLPNNSIDFIITSPPYYNIGIYGDIEPEQIGRGTITGKGDVPTYEEFLDGLQEIYAECLRVLKPGHFFCSILNDFRLKGRFYLFHIDSIHKAEQLGFIPHDLIIYNLGLHPIHAIFLSELNENKTFAKMHEYIEIFRKPN